MYTLPIFSTLVLALALTTASPIQITEKNISKRGVFGDEFSSASGYPGFGSPAHAGGPWTLSSRSYGPSPAEVASIISNAKQASANVMIAQQQVQAAKENVLNQQKVAMDKETTATLLTQKSEAQAAIQRSEAAAAAQAVILAQQRLATAKANVAHQQRIAAAKEAQAAAALQNSAHAAAIEIQKTEHEASKFANLHRTGQGNAAFSLSATKDAAFSPITAGTNHVSSLNTFAWPAGGFGGHSFAGDATSGWAPAASIPNHFGAGFARHNFAW